MRVVGPADSEVSVFTQKEGFLAAIAHDLHLTATEFRIELEDAEPFSVKLVLPVDKLRVVSAMQDGQPQPNLLSDSDRKKIQKTLQTDVLAAAKYPTIEFVSTAVAAAGADLKVTGELRVRGKSKTISVTAKSEGDSWSAAIPLHQPDFGITPYKALMGTLKVAADVRVVVRIPKA